jgi:hypothetical protein
MPPGLVGDAVEAALPIALVGGSIETESHPSWLLSPRGIERHGEFVAVVDSRGYAIAKRVFDVVFALILLALSAPLWLAVTALVLMTSPGPVLFRQTRLGRAGQPVDERADAHLLERSARRRRDSRG